MGTLGPVVRDAGRRATGVANRVGRHGNRQRRSCGAGGTGRGRQHRHQGYLRGGDELGRLYNIQFVRAGTYEITISLPGFQTFKATGVEVANNQVVRTNAVLKVGGLTESVSVEAEAQLLNTDSAAVSETIGKRAIVDLPSSGRNVWSLASTTPGVLAGTNSDIGLSFRGAGQREIQNSLSLDGINSSANLLASTSVRPIADAVERCRSRPAAHRPSTAPTSASTSTS